MAQDESKDRLALLDRDGDAATGSVRSYTRFIKIMRLILPLLAGVIVVIVLSWPRMEKTIQPVEQDDLGKPGAIAQNELINPRFESADQNNNPYVITASRAFQSAQDPEVLLLEDPQGTLTGTGQSFTLTAQNGVYRQKAGKLTLDGQVVLRDGGGYEAVTARLMLDTREKRAWSDQPVSVAGPAGTLDATGMKLEEAQGLLIFTGPARLVLTQGMGGL